MNEREIVAWVDDAIERHNRESERFGDDGPWTDEELYDGIWGRLPVRVRRACARSSFERITRERLVERAEKWATG